ncbi:MAG: hypothetical protein HONBIEJF_00922 [Fimbriimonadaceae bacterium]|nr:hypothetical protein [Fimbriimonadaceae bacterium]
MQRWEALFARTYADGKWTCNPDSAGLVTSLGWDQAMRAERYADAEALARLFLAFDRSQCDGVSWEYHWFLLGSAIIMQGRVREAIEHWESFEPVGTFGARSASVSARNELYSCLCSSDPNQSADPNLLAFVSRLLLKFKGCKRAAAKALVAATNAELLVQLERTYKDGTTRDSAGKE